MTPEEYNDFYEEHPLPGETRGQHGSGIALGTVLGAVIWIVVGMAIGIIAA